MVCAQYGSPVNNGNPGYGGTGIGVPSVDYGHKEQNPIGEASGSDGNSEVSFICGHVIWFGETL